MKTMEAAKVEGTIRYIGFSVHSAKTALAARDRYNFDTVLFPVNFVLFTQSNFGRADSETRTRKGHGHPSIEGDGKDGMICRPEAEPSQAKMLMSACSFH
jgi:hypothetical protein